MAWAVDVRVVSVIGLVFDVCGGDGYAAFALLGGFVDGGVFEEVGVALFGLAFGDCGGKGGLFILSIVSMYQKMEEKMEGGGRRDMNIPFHDRRDRLCLWCITLTVYSQLTDSPEHTDIHMRLTPLKSSGIVPVRLSISRRALNSQSLLDRVARTRPRECSSPRPQERRRKDSHCEE